MVEEGDGVLLELAIGLVAEIRLCGGGFFDLLLSKNDCANEHKSLLTPDSLLFDTDSGSLILGSSFGLLKI